MHERADDLLPLVIAETGATLRSARRMQVPQVRRPLRALRQGRAARPQRSPLAAVGDADHRRSRPAGSSARSVSRQPVGVVACITPYNFPIVNMAGKLGPALATGNTVVVKPAPQDPLAVIELGASCDEVGFPPGVVNVVTGSAPEAGEALVESPRRRHGQLHRLDRRRACRSPRRRPRR